MYACENFYDGIYMHNYSDKKLFRHLVPYNMDEDKKIVSLDSWKKEKEIEREWVDEDIPANPYSGLPIMLASAYWRGNLDGRKEKWLELRWHIATLILLNVVSIVVIILLSRYR